MRPVKESGSAPLARKLGIREDATVALVGAPPRVLPKMETISPGATCLP